MKPSRIFVSLAAPAFLLLAGCSGSKGEALAKQLCDCHESAGKDISRKAACLSKQIELQKQLEGDAAESAKYLQKVSECKAVVGG